MRIALIQQHAGIDKQENLSRGLDAARRAAENGANCIAFAELAFERFHPQCRHSGRRSDLASIAETVPGPLTDACCKLARAHGVVMVINLFERDADSYFDCSPVIDADGSILGRTRMVHITDYDLFHERDYYDEGDTGPAVYRTAAGCLGVAICYDRHFPEYMRALAVNGAELVVIPQAGAVDEWPEGLYEAELRVAAFQNGYFTALCNRVGREELLTFGGESFVCDPFGRTVARAARVEDAVLLADLDLEAVEESHARKLFLRDRRPELYARWLESGVAGGTDRRAGQ